MMRARYARAARASRYVYASIFPSSPPSSRRSDRPSPLIPARYQMKQVRRVKEPRPNMEGVNVSVNLFDVK